MGEQEKGMFPLKRFPDGEIVYVWPHDVVSLEPADNRAHTMVRLTREHVSIAFVSVESREVLNERIWQSVVLHRSAEVLAATKRQTLADMTRAIVAAVMEKVDRETFVAMRAEVGEMVKDELGVIAARRQIDFETKEEAGQQKTPIVAPPAARAS